MVSCSSLRGFPFIAGFFSKDLLLEGLLRRGSRTVGFLLVYLTCFLTGFYRIRLLFSTFRGDGGRRLFRREEGFAHTVSTRFLGFGRVVGGVAFQRVRIRGNDIYVICFLGKICIMVSVVLGALRFLFSGGLTRRVRLFNSFIGKIFFLSLVRGSGLSNYFMVKRIKAAEMEGSIDFNFGSLRLGRGLKSGS